MPKPNENSGQSTDESAEIRTCQIVPREGAFPFKLGMSREEVRSLLGEPGFSKPRRDFYLQNGLSFEYKEEQVIFIHIARSSGLTVTYQNVDVFQTSANDLISIVARDGDYDDTNPEFGQIYDFPKLSVVFWRPVIPKDDNDPKGKYFETVCVYVSGYYDN